jgi:hypothetical protein
LPRTGLTPRDFMMHPGSRCLTMGTASSPGGVKSEGGERPEGLPPRKGLPEQDIGIIPISLRNGFILQKRVAPGRGEAGCRSQFPEVLALSAIGANAQPETGGGGRGGKASSPVWTAARSGRR